MDRGLVPLGFGRVGHNLFRSAYPASSTFSFIRSLNLKSMICLQPADVRQELKEFVSLENIELIYCDVGYNQEPFVSMSTEAITNALEALTDMIRQPVLIFCTTGKIRTSCVVGCYRKLERWSLASIFHEIENFSDPEGGQADLLFVENFTANHSATFQSMQMLPIV